MFFGVIAMLYNYFDDGGYIGIVGFFLLLCLMIGIIIWIAFPTVKMVFSNGIKTVCTEIAVRLIIVLVLVVLTFFICRHSIRAIEYYYDYVTETYSVISGKLEKVDFAPSGGRGEFYSVSFKVNDLDFNNTNISTSIKNAESIKYFENQKVTIYYKIENDQQFIYKIEVANN